MAKKQFKPISKAVNSEIDDFISQGAAVAHVETKKVGRPIERTEPSKPFNCKLPESLFKSLKLDSVQQDTTMTDIVIELLKEKYI